MNLDHVEALASPSPIVAALARAHAQAQARSEAVAQVENRENVLEQTNGNHDQEQIPNDNDATRKRKRAIQQVASVETRVIVIKWMVKDAEENGEKGVAVRAIKNFQADFRGEYKANNMKCTRWWKDREGILTAADASVKSISTVLNTGVKRVQVKVAAGGRSRQRAPWTERLHELLLVEFSRMRATGINLSPSLLRTIALAVIEGSEEWAAEYGSGYVNLSDNIPVKEKIKTRWVQHFIVSSGKVCVPFTLL
ncbi:hypothetical protein PsorP6_009631 [Peronosclerospora sorghi]|uniref:Uncharacterized protein n=1 Tax=Peronosclerospora sorghi TaxID=230839 RepID=A0ACC0W0V0_9STRA|nr:hypothetical protein PsorP6_009631 [Peronosclerospora sorghi]